METFERSGNMGIGEQVLRGGAGLLMTVIVLLSPGLSPAFMAALTMAVIYVGFTAATGWDPLYALGHVLQRPPVGPPRGSVTRFSRQEPHAVEHKKAA